METIGYKDYSDLLSEETKKYLDLILKTQSVMEYYFLGAPKKRCGKLLYPYLNAYRLLHAENSGILKIITNYDFEYYNIDQYRSEFSKSFSLNGLSNRFGNLDLSRVDDPEKIVMITPEDILLDKIKDFKEKYIFEISDYIDLDKINMLENITNYKHMEMQSKLDEEKFKGLNAGEINYLENSGRLFSYLKDNSDNVNFVDPIGDNLRGISLIGSLFISEYEDKKYILDYFYKKGFSYDEFKKIFSLDFDKDSLDSYDPTLVLDYYFDTEDSNLSKVLSDEDLNIVLTKLLGKFNISIDELLSMYNNLNRIRNLDKNIESFKKELNKGNKPLFKDIFNMYLNLKNNKGLYDEKFLEFKQALDLKRLAILLTLLQTKNKYGEFFNHNGIYHFHIENDLALRFGSKFKLHDINNNTIKEFSEFIDENQMLDINEFLNNNVYLENYCNMNSINYNYLKYELVNQKYRDLTKEEELEVFTNLEVPKLSDNNIPEFASYGNELSVYNTNINNNIMDINKDVSLSEITSILSKFYPKNRTIFDKLFKKEEDIDLNSINQVSDMINDNINKLHEELKGYDYLRKYIEVYLVKLDQYYKNIEEKEIIVDSKLKELDSNDINNFNKILELQSMLSILKNKKNTFNTSIVLMKQELVKIHHMIVSHFNTINALTMARDDILPLITSELTIYSGRNTEVKAMAMSQNLINLFQSLIDKNVNEAKKNLELLQNGGLPDNLLSKMNLDINMYLNDVENEQVVNKLELKKDNNI